MTIKELKSKMMKKNGMRVLAIYDEETNTVQPTIGSTDINDITINEMYFNYGMLKETETLYHFLNDNGRIFCKEADAGNSWYELT